MRRDLDPRAENKHGDDTASTGDLEQFGNQMGVSLDVDLFDIEPSLGELALERVTVGTTGFDPERVGHGARRDQVALGGNRRTVVSSTRISTPSRDRIVRMRL